MDSVFNDLGKPSFKYKWYLNGIDDNRPLCPECLCPLSRFGYKGKFYLGHIYFSFKDYPINNLCAYKEETL